MLAEPFGRRWLLTAVAIATAWSGPLLAKTVCTVIPTAAEYPVPVEDRQSLRQVQSSVIPELVARGDELAADGKLAEAVEVYDKVFGGFRDRHGMLHQSERCLSSEVYQQVADKLRAVASQLAEQRMNKGYVLDESHSYGGAFQSGALRLYLISNQYDAYIDHSFSYAARELMARDIDDELATMVRDRLGEIERMRDADHTYQALGVVNDRTPLLAEELAAFDKLGEFDQKLKAHLAPLYPKVTDHWLAEEASIHDDAIGTDGMIPKNMLFDRAAAALESGVKRMRKHPDELARLTAHANLRGQELLEQQQYAAAEEYFDIAGNDRQAAKASRLAETQEDAMVERIEAAVKSNLEKMQKTDKEQAAFQDEADEMAAEFGFDLEE